MEQYLKYLTPVVVLMISLFLLFLILILIFIPIVIKHKDKPVCGKIYFMIKNIILIASDQPSIFGLKRIQIIFLTLLVIGVNACYIWIHRHDLTFGQFMVWSLNMFAMIGFTVREVQKQKLSDKTPPQDSPK